MPGIARLHDTSSHGGEIVTASSTCSAGGLGIARVGDLHACPISGHGTTPIITGLIGIVVDGGIIAVRGVSITGCGAIIAGPDDGLSAS